MSTTLTTLSTIASSSPTSIQLRFALRPRLPSPFHIRSRSRGLIRLRASDGGGKPSVAAAAAASDSWVSKDSSGDAFAGWVDEGDDDAGRHHHKGGGRRLGFVAAGVAGIFLFVGLSFVTLYLSKRNPSALKLDMEPLTAQQEVVLSSDDQDNEAEQVEDEDIIASPDEEFLQSDCIENTEALQVPLGKVGVPVVVDQIQGQAVAALQVLKVIEASVQPSDLCTRREYARWLVSASSALSRSSVSKVYPAMYIVNVTELAFDDITPTDPDFASIQGLAEAGLISSKLSRTDAAQNTEGEQNSFFFFPESSLVRQDLVSWKMALEKRQLPEVDKKVLYQCCGFIDIDKINPDVWPALVADQSAGEHGIMTLAFGYTKLFQPFKPVTKGQAAIALSTGEAAEIVGEELARIEAEAMAETAVATHAALVAQVEKDISASFEKDLIMEREKIDAIEKMAQEAILELERLRAEREEENNSLTRERVAVELEMQALSNLKHEVDEQLQSLMSNKMEISFEKEKINKLQNEAESENQAIARLQHELEVERNALSMARAWAEDEAKRAREQAKALEEARDRWQKYGIKVIVDDDLREDATAGVTWVSAGKQSTVDVTVSRAESLVSKLKTFTEEIRGNSRHVIERIILTIRSFIFNLKEWAANSTRKAVEFQDAAVSKASASVQGLQQSAIRLSSTVKEGAKRVVEDCKDGVEKISQKFKIG